MKVVDLIPNPLVNLRLLGWVIVLLEHPVRDIGQLLQATIPPGILAHAMIHHEEIYMQQPEGFVQKGHKKLVLRLNRAVYGLKQAALTWWKELEASMKD